MFQTCSRNVNDYIDLFAVQESISNHPNIISAKVNRINVFMACCQRNFAKEMADFTMAETHLQQIQTQMLHVGNIYLHVH